MFEPTHPIFLVRELVNRYPIRYVHLSKYRYTPNSVRDERENFRISSHLLYNEEFLNDFFWNLRADEDVAFHSLVELENQQEAHIPMIDMNTRSRAHLSQISRYLERDLFDCLYWYNSGRSFHGYGLNLISKDKWVKLMGSLLLCNQRDMPPVVDARWIGHRLLAGYAALRWTMNSRQYLSIPKRIGINSGPASNW